MAAPTPGSSNSRPTTATSDRRAGQPASPNRNAITPASPTRSGIPPPSPSRSAVPARRPLPRASNSSIRIRRLTTSSPQKPEVEVQEPVDDARRTSGDDSSVTGRRRSSSAPQRMNYLAVPGSDVTRQSTNDQHLAMPVIDERAGVVSSSSSTNQAQAAPSAATRPRGLSDLHTAGSGMQAAVGAGVAARANRGLTRIRSNTVRSRPEPTASDEYDERVLGLLDLVDPEVQTLGTLTNVQNSLFVPDLGRLLNRRPTYDLTSRPSTAKYSEAADSLARSRAGTLKGRPTTASTAAQATAASQEVEQHTSDARRTSISSQLTERHFAVLPHGETLEGWTDEDIAELNDHVRHMLHSRREGFKRSWRGFKKYISKPLGLFVFIYAVLITLFGATWVIFLIGWISVGNNQSYAIDVIDNVLVALFALIGDGMAPFRAVDTYHMCFIARYHHLTWRLREKKKLPELTDHNDLPSRRHSNTADDLEPGENVDDAYDKAEFSVLSMRQQKRLQYHQMKFSKSHTFYRPHETSTHHAFPLRLLVAVVVLLDCHSLFQVALGTCTWSIPYQVRPQALTATILSCSITCNIAAGVLVSIGDKRTRKKEVLDKIFRQDLTKEAIERIVRRHTEHKTHAYDAAGERGSSEAAKDKGRISLDFARINRDSRSSKDTPRKSKELTRVPVRADVPSPLVEEAADVKQT